MEKQKLKGMIFAALFAALTAAIAPVKIPLGFTPVPITLQTIAVLLSGAMAGPYYGALAMAIYVLVGIIGLPVFAGGSSGIQALYGPTGGYLISYFIAAFVIGKYLQGKAKRAAVRNQKIGATHGKIVTGLPWSAILVGWVLPFLIGDAIKLLLAAWIANNVDVKKYMK